MNPFIPLRSANLAIVDARISREIEDSLIKLGLELVKTIKCENVDESISYHPDIVIHPVNYNTLVIAPNVFNYYKEKLKRYNIKLVCGEKVLKSEYPDDIAYNVGRLGDTAIHNFKYTDPVLNYYLNKEKLRFVNTRQGYSKCSLAIIGEGIALTSDYPIYSKLNKLGFEILLIQSGHIQLEGQKYGFIGGTNGNIDKYKTVFSGSINSHPDREKIIKFAKTNNVSIEFLSSEKIIDIGTIITLSCN